MEFYHDASNPRIRVVTGIDPPALRDNHCTGPHLVGCRAHAGLREVALHDCGRAIGGAFRVGELRPASLRGENGFCKHKTNPRGGGVGSSVCYSPPLYPPFPLGGGKAPTNTSPRSL